MEALQDKAAALEKIYKAQAEKVKLIAEQLNKAKAQYGDNSKQADNLRIALNRAESAMNETETQIAQNEKALEELEAATGEAEKGHEKLAAAMSKLGSLAAGALKAGLTAAGVAVGALATAAGAGAQQVIQLGDSYQKAMGQLAAQTGAAGEELEALGQIATQVYGAGFGESLESAAQGVATVRANTGLMGEELKAAAQAGYLLSDVFDMDLAESSRAASALMNKFGLSAQEAYNLIAHGAQKGANQNGDLLDVIAEYAPKFAEAGLSAEQMMQALISGADQGVFSIDKVGDAVKEFAIRAVDGSDSTAQAFKDIGLNAKEMSSAMAQGGDSARAAFEQTVQALLDMEDPLARNQAAVALFGTQYEDLGAAALPILESMFTDTTSTADALSAMSQVKYDNLTDALAGVKRQIEADLLPIAGQAAQQLTQMVSDISAALSDGFQPEDIKAIGDGVAQKLMEGIQGITTLIGENSETFSGAVNQIVGIMAETLPTLVDTLSGPAMELLDGALSAMTENAEAIGGAAGTLVTKLGEFLTENASGLMDAAGDVLGGLVDGLLAEGALAKLTTAAIEMIGKLAAALVENAGELLAKAPEIIGQLIQGFQDVDWAGVGKDLLDGGGEIKPRWMASKAPLRASLGHPGLD